MDKANNGHKKELYRVLKYVLDTKNLKLKINPLSNSLGLFYIAGKSDSDFTGDKNDRRSITGWLVYFMGVLIGWKSKVQGHITLSLTKAELIDAVAQKAGVSKADAERTVGAFFELVVASAKKGDKVAWPGFGSFSTSKRKARTGRNPQTGAPVQVPASVAMKFTSSSTLKAELNPNRK